MAKSSITLHKNDLPAGLSFGPSVAVDTETLGLNVNRDRLCLVQLSSGDGSAHLVQFDGSNYAAPQSQGAAHRSGGAEDLPLRALRHRRASRRTSAW